MARCSASARARLQRLVAVVLQQVQELTGLASDRFTAQQGGLQQGLALGDSHREPVGRGRGGFSFLLQQSLLMSGVGDHLVSVVAAAVASHFGSPIENAHQGVRSDQRQLPAHGRGRNRVVVEIEAYINGLVRFSGHHQVGFQGVGRKGQQLRFFLFEDSRNGARSIAGPGSTVSDLIPPAAGLAIEVGQGSKGAGGKERGANVLDRSFHASFFIPPSHMAGPGGEVVVSGQLQQSGMKANGIAAALHHYAFKVVVKENSGASTPLRKGPHVAAQEVLQRLVKEKLQGQRARIRQRQQQTGEPAGGVSDLYCAKRSPVPPAPVRRQRCAAAGKLPAAGDARWPPGGAASLTLPV